MKSRIVMSSVSLAVLALVGFVALGAQRSRPADAIKTSGSELVRALREPVAPVTIHQWMFAGPVHLVDVQPLDETGQPARGDVYLESVGSGVVIDGDAHARVLKDGDTVYVGEVIVGGLVENTGDTRVRLSFGQEGRVTLAPGRRLYVGPAEHLLRDDVAHSSFGPTVQRAHAVRLRERPTKTRKSPTVAAAIKGGGGELSCFVCECDCQNGEATICVVQTAATRDTICTGDNGLTCECDNGSRGTTGDCSKAIVPCPDSR